MTHSPPLAAAVSPVLVIDNYDSFVFNLARYVEELGAAVLVRRNDELTVQDVRDLNPAAIILSPGPCTPREAGICLELIPALGPQIPLLGVCLGHQAIGAALGGRIVRAPEPVHGRTSLIEHDGTGLFSGCERPLRVGRYHSLAVDGESLPAGLRVTARTPDGVIMAFVHRTWPVYGVQFHPESILTSSGHRLLANFLPLAGLSLPPANLPGDAVVSPPIEDDFYQRDIGADARRPA